MLSCKCSLKIPQLSLSEDYPPKEHGEPILKGDGSSLKQTGFSTIKVENMNDREIIVERVNEKKTKNNSANNSFTRNMVPMSKLEIPMFDGKNSRWWVTRCHKFF